MNHDLKEVIDLFREITETTSVQHVWTDDGIYHGREVCYKNPLHPDLQVVFHPYIPLVIYGQPMPVVDREYFVFRGLPVPPGGPETH